MVKISICGSCSFFEHWSNRVLMTSSQVNVDLQRVFLILRTRMGENLGGLGGRSRPSHLRRAIFGPSKWPVYLGSVRAISGSPSRQTANRGRPAGPVYYVNLLTFGPSMARLLNAHRPFLARLVFSNEKACYGPLQNLIWGAASGVNHGGDREGLSPPKF